MSLGWVDTLHFSLIKDFKVIQTQRKSTQIHQHDFHIFTPFYFLFLPISLVRKLCIFHFLQFIENWKNSIADGMHHIITAGLASYSNSSGINTFVHTLHTLLFMRSLLGTLRNVLSIL